jgi:hypothetical protein
MARSVPRSSGSHEYQRIEQYLKDLQVLRGVERDLSAWAEKGAAEEDANQQARLDHMETAHNQEVVEAAGLFALFEIELPTPLSVSGLHAAWPAVSDYVDRHLRDQRNLETRSARFSGGEGRVSVEVDDDPVVDTARRIRDSLPALEASQQELDRLRAKVEAGVDPLDFDDRHCAILDDMERTHGPMVQLPDVPDPRPMLPPDVADRLRGFGL